MLSRLAIPVVLLALLAAACSNSTTISTGTEAPTTVTAGPQGSVVFGSGSVPETVPTAFPIPESAVIGSTLVDRNRGVTEMAVRVSADTASLVAFFDTNLPSRGFSIDSSREEGNGHRIEFSGDALTGTIEVSTAARGVAQALVTFIDGS